MIVENKSDLKVGERYHQVELPCAFTIWIEITGYDEKTGIYSYAHVAKRHTEKIELYDTFLKSNFDDYFSPTRKRHQVFFTDDDKEGAKAYHERLNEFSFNTIIAGTNILYNASKR